jgi:hypothetical protein
MNLASHRRAILLEMVVGDTLDRNLTVKRDRVSPDTIDGTVATRVMQQKVIDAVAKTLLGTVSGFQIWIVDGQKLRLFDHDFTDGGNGARYPYIPSNQIWIDDGSKMEELAPFIVHEISEFKYMVAGASYDQAHERANALEDKLRRVLMSMVARPHPLKALGLAERYLGRFGPSMSGCCCKKS